MADRQRARYARPGHAVLLATPRCLAHEAVTVVARYTVRSPVGTAPFGSPNIDRRDAIRLGAARLVGRRIAIASAAGIAARVFLLRVRGRVVT